MDKKFEGHTPGPWHIKQGRTSGTLRNDVEQFGDIYLYGHTGHDAIANRALIEAAPDLLAENERLLKAINEARAQLSPLNSWDAIQILNQAIFDVLAEQALNPPADEK